MQKTTPKTTPETVYLADYQAPDFTIEQVDLDFSLFEAFTLVTCRLRCTRENPQAGDLPLQGEGLQLLDITLDGKRPEYHLTDQQLTVCNVPDQFVLSTQVRIDPANNTCLEGLYRSNGIFATQCEAEGFRRITYFLDRPDVMARYQVRIEADKNRYPVLLSNGNLLESGDLPNAEEKGETNGETASRHYALWQDPFKKPCYLFALVAGDLAHIDKTVQTASGRDVLLQVYTEPAFIHQADYALDALHRALKWDEQTFALEYDLDRYMVVAISDFNMGAMENKGLNIFNSKYVLATPESATDKDFLGIESVVAHEYFHNWTGNRVTCRDWFQLSLKEGLTVFRDSLFSADMTHHGVKRLADARMMREHQFLEDQGPMRHPVRPNQYIEINNFYTLTVYEKGAEVIHMLWKLLGEETFKAGLATYFARHDGQAVTVEDFIAALADAAGKAGQTALKADLLGAFFAWYSQAGTPTLLVETQFDAAAARLQIHFRQHAPESNESSSTENSTAEASTTTTGAATTASESSPKWLIPINYRLFDTAGQALGGAQTYLLRDTQATLTLENITSPPVLSVLRGFSAPVQLLFEQSSADQHLLVRHDDDLYVRFAALTDLQKQAVSAVLATSAEDSSELLQALSETYRQILVSEMDAAEKAALLSLPPLTSFYSLQKLIAVQALYEAWQQVKRALFTPIVLDLQSIVSKSLRYDEADLNFAAISERQLHNACWALLAETVDKTDSQAVEGFTAQWLVGLKDSLENGKMTNQLARLQLLNRFAVPERETHLAAFYQKHQSDPQIVDKWFALYACQSDAGTLEQIRQMSKHADFNIRNPNRVRALLSTFAMQNPRIFHQIDGQGYQLLTDFIIQLDAINPSIAARLVTALLLWRQFAQPYQELMRQQLSRLASLDNLSSDLYEVVGKALADV